MATDDFLSARETYRLALEKATLAFIDALNAANVKASFSPAVDYLVDVDGDRDTYVLTDCRVEVTLL